MKGRKEGGLLNRDGEDGRWTRDTPSASATEWVVSVGVSVGVNVGVNVGVRVGVNVGVNVGVSGGVDCWGDGTCNRGHGCGVSQETAGCGKWEG